MASQLFIRQLLLVYPTKAYTSLVLYYYPKINPYGLRLKMKHHKIRADVKIS